MQKFSVCVLGSRDSYTHMVVQSLRSQGVKFTLILEDGGRESSRAERILGKPLAVYYALTTGRFKALPKLSFFTIRAFLRERLFVRSAAARCIMRRFDEVKLDGFKVPSINHVKTLRRIEKEGFDIGVLAGVGIIDGAVIEAFSRCCLNAHPAPLPQCRGGGALINTLNYGLQPAASVHIATAGIDEGDILRVRSLELLKDDCFDSLNLRLAVLCSEILAEVTKELASGAEVTGMENRGKLHYWRDCTIEVQRQAERKLQSMLRDL